MMPVHTLSRTVQTAQHTKAGMAQTAAVRLVSVAREDIRALIAALVDEQQTGD